MLSFSTHDLDYLGQFVALFSLGLGLLIAGIANLSLRRIGPVRRLLVTGMACGASFLVCGAATANGDLPWTVVAVMAAGVVPCLILGTGRGHATVAWVVLAIRRPAIHWGLCGVAGTATIAVSVIWFERRDAVVTEAATRELVLAFSPAPGRAISDRGSALTPRAATYNTRYPVDELPQDGAHSGVSSASEYAFQRGPASYQSNCHGWVFAAGQYWIDDNDVETILRENGYEVVASPKPGDLAVYRSGECILHTAVVRYVSPGLPVLVEGKWGAGRVYLHAADASPYGAGITYYRSPRPGHQLACLVMTRSPEPTTIAGN
jgi:hypothetical protein